MKPKQEETTLKPSYPGQCIHCTVFDKKGLKFIIDPRHDCWFFDELTPEVVEQRNLCPECGAALIFIEEDENYCPECGLVTSCSVAYVGGHRIDLPYGFKI